MRKEFSAAIERIGREDDKVIFITGDLGYSALENVADALGPRFINAGVAEQNMVGVAAGLAYKGYKVFCYSIAPFVVYRCLEQFRNDVCPASDAGFSGRNGGGYGYGIMGSTHHAIEDLACLSSLQNVNTYIPAFADEVEPMLNQIVADGRPTYLRLGAGPNTPDGAETYGSFKQVVRSAAPLGTVVALGPVAANVLTALNDELLAGQFDLFTATNLPLDLPNELAHSWAGKPMLVVEEHVSVGGLAQQLSVKLLADGVAPSRFISLSAQGYPNGLYGDQKYHQQLSGLDPASIARQLAFVYQLKPYKATIWPTRKPIRSSPIDSSPGEGSRLVTADWLVAGGLTRIGIRPGWQQYAVNIPKWDDHALRLFLVFSGSGNDAIGQDIPAF